MDGEEQLIKSSYEKSFEQGYTAGLCDAIDRIYELSQISMGTVALATANYMHSITEPSQS